jgi:hypothetical protein
MPSPWKDFSIEKLRGELIPNANENATKHYKTPTTVEYNQWMINVKKTLGACRQKWLLAMALKLHFVDGVFMPIVDQDFEDFVGGFQFKYVTIQNALDAGGSQSLPEPGDPMRDLYHGDHMDLNYIYIVDSIATFSAQMSLRCIECFPSIYGRMTMDSHPYEGLHEFVLLHREYHATPIQEDTDAAWTKVIKATEWSFEPDAASVKEWLERAELAVIELVTSGVTPAMIDSVIVGNCIGKFEMFQEHTAQSAKWVSRGNEMTRAHAEKSMTWRMFVTVVTGHINKDVRTRDRDEAMSAMSTPEKKKPKIETPDSANFFSQANLQAFQAFLTGREASTGGKFKRNCPICKVHHEKGIQSCPRQDDLKAHLEAMSIKYADERKGNVRQQRQFRGPKGKDFRKADVNPIEKIDGMLSAAGMIQQEKKDRAAAGAVADGQKMTPAKAKALIVSFTEHIKSHTGMWTSIVHPAESLDMSVATVLSFAAQVLFLIWMVGMTLLTAQVSVQQLQTVMSTVGLLMIGFIIYSISTPPTPGNLQIGMPAVVANNLPTAFLSNLTPNDRRGYLDSCASISIWKDADMLHNIREMPPISLTGVNGTSTITKVGDLNFWAKGVDGAYHNTVLTPVLLAPDSPVNLVSVDQVSAAGGKCHFGKEKADNFVSFESTGGDTRLVVEKVNGIHAFVNDLQDVPDLADSDSEDEDGDEDTGPAMAWMGDCDSLTME